MCLVVSAGEAAQLRVENRQQFGRRLLLRGRCFLSRCVMEEKLSRFLAPEQRR